MSNIINIWTEIKSWSLNNKYLQKLKKNGYSQFLSRFLRLKRKLPDYDILSSISLIHAHIISDSGSEICNSSGKTAEKVKLCFSEESGAGFNKMLFSSKNNLFSINEFSKTCYDFWSEMIRGHHFKVSAVFKCWIDQYVDRDHI